MSWRVSGSIFGGRAVHLRQVHDFEEIILMLSLAPSARSPPRSSARPTSGGSRAFAPVSRPSMRSSPSSSSLRRRAARPHGEYSASNMPTAPRWTTFWSPPSLTVREAAKRSLGQRHFDVQLIGGMVLHEGNIAEMKTGEGKTLGRHARRLPQRPCRQGRARRHRQRLPRQARRRVDGAGLPLPRA